MESGVELCELNSSASSDSVNSVVLSVSEPRGSTTAPPSQAPLRSGDQRRPLANGGVSSSQLSCHDVVDQGSASSSDDDDDDDDLLRHGDDIEMPRQCKLLNTTSSSSSSSEENVIL